MPGREHPGGEAVRGGEAVPGPAPGRRIDARPPREDADHYWQHCVNCGTRLEGRKCKLICPTCGFFHSCSEP